MKISAVFFVFFGGLVLLDVCSATSTYINYVFPTRIVSNVMGTKLADSIGDGIKQAMEHCSEQFRWKQWNCPKSVFSRRITQKLSLTKEIAFARALTSAGIMHSLSKHCAKSGRGQCDCDAMSDFLQETMLDWETKSPFGKYKSIIDQVESSLEMKDEDFDKDYINKVENKDEEVSWSWGGCSDDPGFAEKTTRKLFEDFEVGTDALAFAERQNNLVGQRVVKDSLTRVCRCHGLSGSCSHQTCWMQVAPFDDIVANLVRKYRKAIKMSYAHVDAGWNIGHSQDMLGNNRQRKIKTKQLVFLDESPDYCIADVSTGWPGTLGRLCLKENSTDPEERKSCQNLCRNCGYGLRRETRIMRKRCKCAFKMCCEVKCDICEVPVEEYFCE